MNILLLEFISAWFNITFIINTNAVHYETKSFWLKLWAAPQCSRVSPCPYRAWKRGLAYWPSSPDPPATGTPRLRLALPHFSQPFVHCLDLPLPFFPTSLRSGAQHSKPDPDSPLLGSISDPLGSINCSVPLLNPIALLIFSFIKGSR